jgi:hypothetical protein
VIVVWQVCLASLQCVAAALMPRLSLTGVLVCCGVAGQLPDNASLMISLLIAADRQERVVVWCSCLSVWGLTCASSTPGVLLLFVLPDFWVSRGCCDAVWRGLCRRWLGVFLWAMALNIDSSGQEWGSSNLMRPRHEESDSKLFILVLFCCDNRLGHRQGLLTPCSIASGR